VIVNRLWIRTFGALAGQTVELHEGMNVVVGLNEAGKSTIFRALAHTLLTPTDIDKRRFDR